MKILVPVKRVLDYKTHIRINPEGTALITENSKMITNPFDEIALEEAVRIKDEGRASEIIVVSIGLNANQDILRAALAMGADRAFLVKDEGKASEPLAVAHILAAVAKQEKIDFIILGKQAVDTDDNQVGQMLAALLNWPQACFASKLIFHDAENKVSVVREIDGGLETLKLTMPAVITTDLRLNNPRYLTLPNIIKAKNKPLTIISLASLAEDFKERTKILQLTLPDKKRQGIKLANAQELVDRLKHESQVL